MYHNNALQAALAGLITGPLADREDYNWSLLVRWWPSTGYTLAQLKQALREAVAAGHFALHGDEIEASYRLLPAGRAALHPRPSARPRALMWSVAPSL